MVVLAHEIASEMELLELMAEQLPELRPHLSGANIRRARKARGLTQKELGEVFGLSERAVRNWEKDTWYPRDEVRDKLAEFLGLLDPGKGKIRGMNEAAGVMAHEPELKMIRDHVDLMQKQLETVTYLLDRVLGPRAAQD